VLDFNGDGKSDLMLIKDNTCEILTFNNWEARRVYYSTFFVTKNHLVYLGDFNGDRKTDLLFRSSLTNNAAPWTYAISYATGFLQTPFTFQKTPNITGVYSDDHLSITDYNGDGKMDIYHGWNYFVSGSASTSRLDMYYSTGAYGFYHRQYTFGATLGFTGNQVFDLNGDGRSDNVNLTYYGSPFDIFYFKKDGKEHLLSKVRSGFNHITEWTYKKLPDAGTFYTRGALSAHPVNNIQPPLYCVFDFKGQNGIGGYTSTQYSYEEAKIHKTGKGFLGFKKITASNITTGTKTVSENELNTTFFVNVPYRTSTYLTSTSALLNQVTNTNELMGLGSQRYWYRVNSTSENKAFEGRTAVSTNNTWDSNGNVLTNTSTVAGGGTTVQTTTTTTVYGAYVTSIPNRPTSVTVANTRTGQPVHSVKTTYAYNTLGQMTSKTDFSGLTQNIVSTYEYFPLGNLKKTTITPASMTARATSSTYDSKGRFAVTNTNELGQVSSATYDAKWGKPLTVTGISGLVTTYEYDGFGRQKKITNPEGFSVNYTYGWDISGTSVWYNLASHPGKPDVKTWFDILGRQVKQQTEAFPAGQWTTQTQTYDSKGNLATSTRPYKTGETALTTTNTYDTYDRLITSGNTTFGTTTISYAYASGNLTTTTTNPASQVSSNVTDASGQVISATDHAGTLTYTYDSQGNMLTVKAGTPVIVTNEYDVYGNQTKLIDRSAGTTTYAYNALSQLTSQTNANSQTHTMVYDLLGRNTSRVGPEGTTTYEYFPVGTGALAASVNKIKKITGFAGNLVEYTYDSFGRTATQKETVDATAHTTTYGYNTYGDIVTTVYPSGFGTNHAYDANGFPTTIKNNTNTVTIYTNTGMNGLGQNTTYTLGNTKATTRTFNHGMPLKYSTAAVHDLEFTWNYLSGNLTKRKDVIKSKEENFTYDNLNRLLSSTVTGLAAQTMVYHPSGSFVSKSDVGSYSYHATNQNAVTEVTNSAAVISTLTQDVTYNAFMQPSKITETSSGVPFELTYTYGYDYERIKSITKQSGSVINTRYYFGAGYEKDVTGGVTRYIQYVAAPAGLVAIVVNEGTAAPVIYYTYTDHLGSILRVTNSTGAIVAEQEFDAWGRRRNASTWVALAPTVATGLPVWLFRGYTSHEHLDRFGLINMNGRIYDPVVARVLSPDNFIQNAYSSQDHNRYSYSKNNPLIYSDPDGQWIHLAVGAVIGGVTNWVANGAKFNMKGLGHFGVGALAGALSAGIGAGVNVAMAGGSFAAGFAGTAGGIASTGFVAGAATGAAAGFTNGLISGTGNGLLGGSSFGNSLAAGLTSGVKQGMIGGLSGGILGGIDALTKDVNFFSGKATFDIPAGGAAGTPGVGFNGKLDAKFAGKFEGINVYESAQLGYGQNSAGITLPGKGIFVGKGAFSLDPSNFLLKHEFGHILQARLIGNVDFYSKIGVSSLSSATRHGFMGHSHNTFWTEVWANQLSYDHFGKPAGWLVRDVLKRFPLQFLNNWDARRVLTVLNPYD